MRCYMQAKPEFRKSERFGHENIIKFDDDRVLSPYYALSQNLSETGMHFTNLCKIVLTFYFHLAKKTA